MPSASASFSANCTGSFGVLMPMRTDACSGFGNSPAAGDGCTEAPVVGDAVVVPPPPHAIATSPAARIEMKRRRAILETDDTPLPPERVGLEPRRM